MIYIALLRGVNVGGKHKVNMAELRSMLERMGFRRVQTYIQSGNVLFESDEDADKLRSRIEEGIRETFGVPAAVVLRTADEFDRIVAGCPYAPDTLPEGASLHVSLLVEPISQDDLDSLTNAAVGGDEFRLDGFTVYLLFRQSVLDSKLAARLQKLGTLSTSRNWNTIVKLKSMADAMGREATG
ncbi:DUF1697 domain-containing protein [Paenibacillus flagellatus]|uniref:Cytoplasmic protein n=1 Tax=Paenibacillus flagellatus TaxID=2211139 RepID=A0A2V5K7S9_9BACL|nr:DUF1697 domain-containing protein [Paenibacillus flagellatus]PYI55501.1 cytoplasmic protein [Paenibacillus flagellatus]